MSIYRPLLQMQGALVRLLSMCVGHYRLLCTYVGLFCKCEGWHYRLLWVCVGH